MKKGLFQAIEYISGVPGKLEDTIKQLKEKQGLVEVLGVEGAPNGSTKIILYSTKKSFDKTKNRYNRNMTDGALAERDCNKVLTAINKAGFQARRVRFKTKEEKRVNHHLYKFPFTIEVY